MSVLNLASSLERTAPAPGDFRSLPFTPSGSFAQARRVSVAGRFAQAARGFHAFVQRALLPPKSRRLRVRETASLGDKRFVSIVQVDGVDYLIGGGSASVALLTQLGPAKAEATFQQAFSDAQKEPEIA